MSMISR